MLLSFRYFKKYREYVLDLCRSGFASVLLEELNHFHESVEGSMASSSIQRYQRYLYIGALLNMAVIWLPTDEKTSPEELARFFLEAVDRMLDG